MKKVTIVPFVKWVGGKRQLLKIIESKIPAVFKNYYEPFVGGGALLFHLQHQKAIINDLNKELINAYKVIKRKKSCGRLIEYLLLMEYGHQKLFYNKIRQMDRNEIGDRQLTMKNSKELRAARFIYLNKAGFNGLYRVNKNGEHNVPTGKRKTVKTFDELNINAVSKYLNNVEIHNKEYFVIALKAQKGDFVYFDPPYDYEVGHKGFVAYQKDDFKDNAQRKLATICKALDKKGVMFMLSNHNTALIRNLYAEFNIEIVKAKRIVGGKGASRKEVEEVLIRNYEK